MPAVVSARKKVKEVDEGCVGAATEALEEAEDGPPHPLPTAPVVAAAATKREEGSFGGVNARRRVDDCQDGGGRRRSSSTTTPPRQAVTYECGTGQARGLSGVTPTQKTVCAVQMAWSGRTRTVRATADETLHASWIDYRT